jgi:hypothetical protein
MLYGKFCHVEDAWGDVTPMACLRLNKVTSLFSKWLGIGVILSRSPCQIYNTK